MIRIMMVDDEPHVIAALTRTLHRDWSGNATIESFTDPRLALKRVAETSFDVIISDYRMPGMDGITLLTEVRKLQPATSRLILSASTDYEMLVSAINEAGAARFIAKPWQEDDFLQKVREAVDATFDAREQLRLADERRLELDVSAEIVERHRMENIEPGITRVHWGPNGEVLLDDE